MFGGLKRAWRIFRASPSRPLTAGNLQATMSKLYGSDASVRQSFDQIGITADMLSDPAFDLRAHLVTENRKIAMTGALASDGGIELITRAADLELGSPELAAVVREIEERFGSPQLANMISMMPEP